MSKEEQISDSWEEEFDTFAPLNMGYEPARKRHEEIKSFIKKTLAKQKEEEIAKLKNSGRLMFMEGVKDAKREVVEICKDYIKEVDGCDDVKIIIKRITNGK